MGFGSNDNSKLYSFLKETDEIVLRSYAKVYLEIASDIEQIMSKTQDVKDLPIELQKYLTARKDLACVIKLNLPVVK